MTLPNRTGVPPGVLNRLTLGHAARLGELYDERSGQFLSVQLYEESKIKEASTNLNHTDLSLTMSNSFERKATVLDIKAELSLEILAGLIEVSGSATYLSDAKSNTHERAWAMALKMRIQEKRVLFAEESLGRNILQVAKEDYIATDLATHFVSAIIYGGNIIVNLVARSSHSTEDENVEGNLEADLRILKSLVDLRGGVDLRSRSQFEGMNDKFEIVLYGDVALEKIPTNAQDVLDTFSEAARLLREGGGVPISVVLQPIPAKLREAATFVYHIDKRLVDDILDVFSKLDDLRSRFAVLIEGTNKRRDLIPELARMSRLVGTRYAQKHGHLLHQLGKFVSNFQHGRTPDLDSAFALNIADSSNPTVLDAARQLHNLHHDPNYRDELDGKSTQYSSSLVGLENAFSCFRSFVSDVRRAWSQLTSGSSLANGISADRFSFSSLEDVCRAPSKQDIIPLFVMTPLTSRQSHLAIYRFLALLRGSGSQHLSNPSIQPYVLYAESLQNLEDNLPNDEKFLRLKNPAIFVGWLTSEGELSWKAAGESHPTIPAISGAHCGSTFSLNLCHFSSSQQSQNELYVPLDGIDGTKSFSLVVRAKWISNHRPDNKMLLQLVDKSNCDAIGFEMPARVVVRTVRGSQCTLSNGTRDATIGEALTLVFVQNTEIGCRYLYVNHENVAEDSFYNHSIDSDWNQLKVSYILPRRGQWDDVPMWWDGEVNRLCAYPRALGADEIARISAELLSSM